MAPKQPDTGSNRPHTRSQSGLKLVFQNPRYDGISCSPQAGYENASTPKCFIEEYEAHYVQNKGDKSSLKHQIQSLQAEQQKLHASALLLKLTLQDLQAANAKTNAAIDLLQQQFQGLTTEEQEVTLRIHSLRQMVEDLQHENTELKIESSLRQRRMEILKDEHQVLHSTTSALQERIQQLQAEKEGLIETATSLQQQALKHIEKGDWAPKEDNLIREEFSDLQEGIRLWSRKYGAGAVSDLDYLCEETRNSIISDLRKGGYCSESSWDTLIQKSGGYHDKIPTLLLQAMVAKDIFTEIFHPFFPFTPDPINTTPDLPTPVQLDRVYRDMRLVDASKAHIWRSQMLRNLFSQIKYQAHQAAEHRMAKLLNSHVRHLCKLDIDLGPGEAELQHIGKKAVNLALSLWTQREYLIIGNQDKFPVFKSSCKIITAHRLHHLDDEDERLDGKEILLCVQPTIIAKGNKDAEDYDKIKGWAKATMFLKETDG